MLRARSKERYLHFVSLGVDVLITDAQTEVLTDAYIGHQILTEKYRNDMVHIALAAVHNIDIVVSWNSRHIVHYDKIAKSNAVNLEYGFRQLMILSPREVTSHGQD
jgi:hypothetical protein